MSDGTRGRPATTGRTRQRKGGPRGGRHGLTRPAATTREAGLVGDGLVVAAPTRTRRSVTTAGPRVAELTREQEFVYIRSDMRRLFVIASVLLAVMLVLLFVVSR